MKPSIFCHDFWGVIFLGGWFWNNRIPKTDDCWVAGSATTVFNQQAWGFWIGSSVGSIHLSNGPPENSWELSGEGCNCTEKSRERVENCGKLIGKMQFLKSKVIGFQFILPRKATIRNQRKYSATKRNTLSSNRHIICSATLQAWKWLNSLPWALVLSAKWVCLKIGYIPNYSHLIGIMIINHWV